MLSVLTPRGVAIVTIYLLFIVIAFIFLVGLPRAPSGGSTSDQPSFSTYPETREEFMHRCTRYYAENRSDRTRGQIYYMCRQEWNNR
jgi:hypothetical protein